MQGAFVFYFISMVIAIGYYMSILKWIVLYPFKYLYYRHFFRKSDVKIDKEMLIMLRKEIHKRMLSLSYIIETDSIICNINTEFYSIIKLDHNTAILTVKDISLKEAIEDYNNTIENDSLVNNSLIEYIFSYKRCANIIYKFPLISTMEVGFDIFGKDNHINNITIDNRCGTPFSIRTSGNGHYHPYGSCLPSEADCEGVKKYKKRKNSNAKFFIYSNGNLLEYNEYGLVGTVQIV